METPDKQRTFGQYETPPDVADLLLGFCLRRPSDRLLDPSCGTGAFLQRAVYWQQWMADRPEDVPADTLWGAELDVETAAAARTRLPQARILAQNFFTLDPERQRPFDAIVGNPPYTRARWIDHLPPESGQQLGMFQVDEAGKGEGSNPKQQLVPPDLWRRLSDHSGLYAYFFIHGVRFLREGGRFGFVVPNGWLDVAYGEELKQFLLDHFRIVTIIESSVERWFQRAKVNTCLVVLERCSHTSGRSSNLVRLVRLKRPLRQLIPHPLDDYRRLLTVERLIPRLLPGHSRQTEEFAVRVLSQAKLKATAKWGLALRAPTVYRQRVEAGSIPPLKSWATVRRGFTTGANAFFYLEPGVVERWGIEPQFRWPALKSLRFVDRLRLTRDACRHELLWVPPAADLRGTAVSRYIAWGEEQGYHLRRTCAARQPWYSLSPPSRQHPPAHLVLPKGIWRRHFAPVLEDEILVDQQLYQVYLSPGVSTLAAAALLNSTWVALQCELRGRLNFGEGVLWLATYELAALLVPDPRQLPPTQVAELERCFVRLQERPLQEIETELARPDRQALDKAVFDSLGFSAAEQQSIAEALLERVAIRRRRAAGK